MSTVIEHLSHIRQVMDRFGVDHPAFAEMSRLLTWGHLDELEELALAAVQSTIATVPRGFVLVDRDFLTSEQRMELMAKGLLVDATAETIAQSGAGPGAPINDKKPDMTVQVCFDRDRECGTLPQNWCPICPKRNPDAMKAAAPLQSADKEKPNV